MTTFSYNYIALGKKETKLEVQKRKTLAISYMEILKNKFYDLWNYECCICKNPFWHQLINLLDKFEGNGIDRRGERMSVDYLYWACL